MKHVYFTSFLLLTAVLTINAAPRSKRQITDAAVQILNSSQSGIRLAPRQERITELQSDDAVTVMGYPSGGYAIIANDDRMPAVLGYSDTKFDTANPGLQWYMNSAKGVLKELKANNEVLSAPAVDTLRYEPFVEPIVKTRWAQGDPYNRLCPVYDATQNVHYYTGCTATAASQIIFTNRYPSHATGVGSYKILKDDGALESHNSISLSGKDYDFDNMLLSYDGSAYTDQQAEAVAELMRDCGLAFDMQYSYKSGSAARDYAVADGLRNFFGYKNAKRISYSIDKLFRELTLGNPVLFFGEATDGTSHAFVVDGYRNDGYVHVNWGWGAGGGYILLSEKNYTYTENQSMITGLGKGKKEADTITVNTPGTLPELLPYSANKRYITTLKIKGKINSTDLRLLRMYAGRDDHGNPCTGNLSSLDLKGASIVAGGEPYLIDGEKRLTTIDNTLTERAFYHCTNLSKLICPETMDSIGDGAFVGVNYVEYPDYSRGNKKYVDYNGIFYNKDTTEIIQCINTYGLVVELKDWKREIKRIHPYAFEGNRFLHIHFSSSLKEIGRMAFANLYDSEIFFNSVEPPAIDSTSFIQGSYLHKPIMVPYGSEEKYQGAENWTNFSSSIVGYGLNVRAWGQGVYGGVVNIYPSCHPSCDSIKYTGHPVCFLDADTSSVLPVGQYKIRVGKGTLAVKEGGIYIEDGVVRIERAKLYLHLSDISFRAGEKPTFIYDIQGLKNKDTKESLKEEIERFFQYNKIGENGWISTYTRMKSGEKYYMRIRRNAQIQNYELSSDTAIITVKSPTTGIKQMFNENEGNNNDVYYNIMGQRVPKDYKGIVINRKKKFIRR